MSRSFLLLPAIVISLAASGVSAAPQKSGSTWLAASMQEAARTTARLAQTKKMAAEIKLDTTRAQVAKVFPQQDGGLMGSDRTRYYAGEGVMVDVPFDDCGGAWSPKNRVCGSLKVYRSLFHAD